MASGRISGDQAELNHAAAQFDNQAKAIARLVEQVAGAQHVNTGDASLDGLIGGLVSEIIASMGEFGENGVQASGTLLAGMSKNFNTVNQDVQPAGR